jgi:hypothetical protein
MDGLMRPTLRLVHDEPDQVSRLARFREAHPRVVVGAGRGWWQAIIPEADGERVVTRYTLHELLDKLDELTGRDLSTRTAPAADLPHGLGNDGPDQQTRADGNHPEDRCWLPAAGTTR